MLPALSAAAARLWAEDHASRHLGIELLEAGNGESRLRMRIIDTMVNGHGICHGGYLFTLADTAFAFAAYDGNAAVVSSHCSITYMRPIKLGEWLWAQAVQRQRYGRSGLYDVTLIDAQDQPVAEFRVHSRLLAPRS